MRISLLMILTLGLLGACTRVTVFGHTVKEGPARAARTTAPASPDAPAASRSSPAAQPGQPQITRVALEFTPAAQKQVDDDERFNSEALREAIIAELRSRQLLDLEKPGAGRVAVIQMDEFSVRATSNVVLFGYLPSAGVLVGAVRIREAGGGEARQLHVRAEIALNISQRGTDRNPLQNLYSGFARRFADELTATPPPQPQGQSRADGMTRP